MKTNKYIVFLCQEESLLKIVQIIIFYKICEKDGKIASWIIFAFFKFLCGFAHV